MSAHYIMEQGMAQQRGRHTGTTAPPDLVFVFDFEPDSYSYIPDPLAQRPCECRIISWAYSTLVSIQYSRLRQIQHASPRAS